MENNCVAIFLRTNNDEKYVMNVSSFWYKSYIEGIILTTAREIIDRASPNTIINIPYTYGAVTGIKTTDTACIIFTKDNRFSDKMIVLAKHVVVHGLAASIPENFVYINTEIKCQKILDELDVIKYIMIDNIEKLLKRGEKIDDMVIKSEHLKQISDDFVIRTKDLNRCCTIL